MIGGVISKVISAVAPRVAAIAQKAAVAAAPRVVTAPAAQVGRSGIGAGAAGAFIRSTGVAPAIQPAAGAARAAGFMPGIQYSPWAAVPIGAQISRYAKIFGAGAIVPTTIWGYEKAKSFFFPQKYDVTPSVSEHVPGSIPGDVVQTGSGIKHQSYSEFLGGLLSNPAVRYALAGTGVGAAGLAAYELYKRRPVEKKKVAKAKRRVKRRIKRCKKGYRRVGKRCYRR